MNIFKGLDFGIVIPSFLLLCISLIILSSVDMGLFQNQLLFAIVGIVCFLFFSSVHVGSLRNLHLVIYISSLLLLTSLFFLGSEVRGARRWVTLAGVNIQFSEVVKPFLIVAFSSFLSLSGGRMSPRRFLLCCGLFLPIFFLLLAQPDLGSGLIYGIAFVAMLLAGGMNIWYIAGGILFLAVLSPFLWQILADYQRDRIISFINPKHDPLGIGYNAIQSAIAVGSGLLLGRGLGRGVQSQLSFLPERHTDFIFATFSEEFGFMGSAIVLLLYFILFLRLLRVARDARDTFQSFVVIGIFALLLSQTFINIGMNIGLVPITGVTLPLLSYGGSSLISTMILLGFSNAISRDAREKQETLEIR